MGNRINKPMLAVAVGGFNGGQVDFLVYLSQHAIGEPYTLKLLEFQYADHLLEAAHRHPFDLFIVLLNPTLAYSPACDEKGHEGDFGVLSHLKEAYRKPLIVLHNGYAGYSADAIKRAGADAVFGMPFDTHLFLSTLRDCLRIETKR